MSAPISAPYQATSARLWVWLNLNKAVVVVTPEEVLAPNQSASFILSPGCEILVQQLKAKPRADPSADTVSCRKKFSLTISPIHLAFPVFELTGEYALSPKFGAAGIFGIGSITTPDAYNKDVKMPILELGGQAAYYLLGSFRHGLQVGGELLWIKVSPPKDEGVTVAANGIAVGPMIGYKWAAGFGLTLLVQGGYEFLFAQAKATNANGEEIEASADSGVPLINLNIGWSI
jgi:hypothetical protein